MSSSAAIPVVRWLIASPAFPGVDHGPGGTRLGLGLGTDDCLVFLAGTSSHLDAALSGDRHTIMRPPVWSTFLLTLKSTMPASVQHQTVPCNFDSLVQRVVLPTLLWSLKSGRRHLGQVPDPPSSRNKATMVQTRDESPLVLVRHSINVTLYEGDRDGAQHLAVVFHHAP